MDDFEKNRTEYVARLEEQVQHLQRQLGEHKPLADKWTPVATGEMFTEGARVTLQFGGKRINATITNDTLDHADLTSLTTSVIDTLCRSLVVDQLRVIVEPQVDRMLQSRRAVKGAGQW